MPEIVIDLQGVSFLGVPQLGAYTRTKTSFVPAQIGVYGTVPEWMPILGARIVIDNMDPAKGIEVSLSGVVGRNTEGLVSFGVFRDGQLLEQVGAVFVPNSAAVAPLYLRWRDTTPLYGEHAYEFCWRIWSGTVNLGGRGDMNFVANVPSVMTLDEFVI